MPTVLIACGANGLEIPCRLFESFSEAEKVCDEIFLPHIKSEDKDEYTPKGENSVCVSYNCNLDNMEDEPISKQLFTNHYYGSGGPYCFILKHIGYNKAFVGFDLD